MSRPKKRIKKEAVPRGETTPNAVKAVSSYDKELSQSTAKSSNRKGNDMNKAKEKMKEEGVPNRKAATNEIETVSFYGKQLLQPSAEVGTAEMFFAKEVLSARKRLLAGEPLSTGETLLTWETLSADEKQPCYSGVCYCGSGEQGETTDNSHGLRRIRVLVERQIETGLPRALFVEDLDVPAAELLSQGCETMSDTVIEVKDWPDAFPMGFRLMHDPSLLVASDREHELVMPDNEEQRDEDDKSPDKRPSQSTAKSSNRKENHVSKVEIGEHESVTESEKHKENTMKKYTVQLQIFEIETSDIGTEYSPKPIVNRVLMSTDCPDKARELYNLCDALAMGIEHPEPCPDWLVESTLLRIARLIQIRELDGTG